MKTSAKCTGRHVSGNLQILYAAHSDYCDLFMVNHLMSHFTINSNLLNGVQLFL